MTLHPAANSYNLTPHRQGLRNVWTTWRCPHVDKSVSNKMYKSVSTKDMEVVHGRSLLQFTHLCQKMGIHHWFYRASLSDVLSSPMDPHPCSASATHPIVLPDILAPGFSSNGTTWFLVLLTVLAQYPGPGYIGKTLCWLQVVCSASGILFQFCQTSWHLLFAPTEPPGSWACSNILALVTSGHPSHRLHPVCSAPAECIFNESTCFLGLQIRSTSSSLEISDSWPHFQLFQPQCLLGH